MIASSIDIKMDDSDGGSTIHTFVQLDKNAQWFLKGVGGGCTQKGDLRSVDVISHIRDRMIDPQKAVAGDDDYDPMYDLMQVADDTTSKPNKVKQQQSGVHKLTMPTRPPCAAPDGTCKTVIHAYWADATSKRLPYLRTDCVDWLLAYAADELHFQGVVRCEPTPPQSREANCPAVADLHVAWNFNGKAWDGTFVGGPSNGQTKRVALADINATLWSNLHLVKSPHEVSDLGLFWCATHRQVKDVAKTCLIELCKATTRGECDSFEAKMGLNATAPTRFPTKKRKRRAGSPRVSAVADDEQTAVADDVNADNDDEQTAVADDVNADNDDE